MSKPKSYLQTHVSGSTIAKVATRFSNPKRGIVVCIALTGQCHSHLPRKAKAATIKFRHIAEWIKGFLASRADTADLEVTWFDSGRLASS